MDGTQVAIIALALTAAIQIAGVAFFLGRISSDSRSTQRELTEHKRTSVIRAHKSD